jgi:hypothetical protein
MTNESHYEHGAVMDTLKGAALIATFIGVLTIFAMWVSLWENVWQASVVVQYTTLDSTALGLRRACIAHGGGGRRVVG